MPHRPVRFAIAIVAGALATLAAACGDDGPNEVTIEASEFQFQVDSSDFVPGTNTITLENNGT